MIKRRRNCSKVLRHLFSLPENSDFLSILFLEFLSEASFPKEFFFQMPPEKVSKIGIFRFSKLENWKSLIYIVFLIPNFICAIKERLTGQVFFRMIKIKKTFLRRGYACMDV